MKKVLIEDEPRAAAAAENLFDATDYRAEIKTASTAAQRRPDSTPPAGRAFGDAFVGALKLIFLYVPGVAALTGTALAQFVFVSYGDYGVELALGALGFLAAGTFMVMFGLGKMRELGYLKAVGAILAAGALAGAGYGLYSIATGDFGRFGAFWLAAWIVGSIAGLIVKRKLDRTKDGAPVDYFR